MARQLRTIRICIAAMLGACHAMVPQAAMGQFISQGDSPRLVSSATGSCAAESGDGGVLLLPCSASINQVVTFGNKRPHSMLAGYYFAEGSLMMSGRCISAGPGNATGVILVTCAAVPEQTWQYDGTVESGRLRSRSGFCIALLPGIGGERAPVVTATCGQGAEQVWRLQSFQTIQYVRDTPRRDAFEALQRAKVREGEAKWNTLWAKPEASESEQRELEELAMYLDRITLSTKYETYRGRYLMRNYGQINRFCEQGYAFACERLGRTNTAPAPSGGYSDGSAQPSATVNVRTYDQYGNYRGTSTTTRTDAGLMGAK